MVTFPLLHAAGSAVSAPSVALWLLCFAVALVLGAIAGAASAGAMRRPRPRALRPIALRGAALLTALAVIPAAIPVDHLIPASHIEDAAVHAQHCHESPAACADAPVTSGPGQMIDAAPLLAEPAVLSVLLIVLTPIFIGITRRPNLRPPMRLVTASI